MAWSISDLFPAWGDSGEQPSANFQYDGGDQVNEKHLDYLWSSVGTLEDEVRSALSDIDSDGDGIVDKANAGASGFSFDGAVTLGGDLEATNGETIWSENSSHIPTLQLEADSDNDGLIEAFDESLIKDGGSREVDAAELGGSSGSSGQLLQTDGSAASWSTVSLNVGVPRWGTGIDGSVTDSSDKTRSGLLMPTDYTLQSGNTVSVDSSEGILVIVAQNSIEINGTIDATGVGASGGSGGAAGSDSSPSRTLPDAGNNGSNGRYTPLQLGGSGGGSPQGNGDGGSGGDGDTSTYPFVRRASFSTALFDDLNNISSDIGAGGGGGGGAEYIGSTTDWADGSDGSPSGGGGGGAAGPESTTDGGDGGNGGGAVLLAAPDITINGSIIADGEDGQDSASGDTTGGGGGGGAGGLIYMVTMRLSDNATTLRAAGGNGGVASTGTEQTGGNGADGADGQVIKIET